MRRRGKTNPEPEAAATPSAASVPVAPAETQWSHPLNQEAGSTPMPTDPRDIEAALRAGRISQRAVPYYGFRYGERGLRFTRSDSAFLATLPGHPEAVIWRQIEWLAGVLSNRGMPSWLLEMHLRVLSRQLSRAVPERRAEHASLLAVSGRLRDRRLSALPSHLARPLVEGFPAEAGLPPSRLSRGTAQILVAAVADERLGIVNAVRSVEAFFLDELLFPAPFVRAARVTIARAKRA